MAGRITLAPSCRHITFAKVCVARRNMSSPAKRPVSLLGTNQFGGRIDAEQSLDMVKAFADRGHKHLNTAFMYADGKAETFIGGMNLPKTGISEVAMFLISQKHWLLSACKTLTEFIKVIWPSCERSYLLGGSSLELWVIIHNQRLTIPSYRLCFDHFLTDKTVVLRCIYLIYSIRKTVFV